MKKLSLLFAACLFAAALFVSCQHEENETTEPNPENLTKSSDLTNLLKRVANSTTDNDDAIDSTNCVSVKMPYAIYVHDQQGAAALEYQQPVTSAAELEQVTELVNGLTDPQDHFTIIFPVTVVFADGSEHLVENQQALQDIHFNCGQADPQTGDIYCVNLNYPITIFGYDSNFQLANTYTIDNDLALFQLLLNLNPQEFFAIDFPISVTTSSGATHTIHNNVELLDAINTAINDCHLTVNPCGNPQVLTDGLIIYLPFANEARDLIGQQTLISNANYPPLFVPDRSGNANSALSFSGDSLDYLKLSVNDNNQVQQSDSLTVSLWFKMQNTNLSNLEYLFEKSENGNNATFALAVYDLNRPLFLNYTGGNYNLWDNSWTQALANDTTNWHHFVVTINGSNNTVKLYRDGVLRNTDANSSLMLGAEFFDYYLGRNFKGYLDDVRVYRKLLTDDQVNTLYNLPGDSNTCLYIFIDNY